LELMVDVTGAEGAAFVPLDEHGQPQTALSYGELPYLVNETWLDYLASDEVRKRCSSCEDREPLGRPEDCPVLRGPFKSGAGLICLPVQRGERQFGILNLVLSRPGGLDERTRLFIRALLDETALGLEGVNLRRRELSVLRQMQSLRQQTDLSALLNGLLENAYQTLEADFAALLAPGDGAHRSRFELSVGEISSQARPFVEHLLQAVLVSGEPLLLGDLAGDPAGDPAFRPELKALIAAPLLSPDRTVLGAILAGHRRLRGFQPRQLALLQTIAGQAALLVQNAGLMAELEYQTMLQERARLAREIHDGLAQTIGFLKLQAAQLRNQIAVGDLSRARQSIEQADVVVLVLDGHGDFAAQDAHIAGYASEAAKPVIVTINTWDLVAEREAGAKAWESLVRDRLRFVKDVPVLFVSAKSGQRVFRILEIADDLHAAAALRVPTPELNRWLRGFAVVEREGPAKGRSLRLFYAAQTGVRPPRFVLFCNDARRVHFSLRRRIENEIRDRFGFGPIPLRLQFRSRRERQVR
jgi:hypothetical protein